MKFIASVSGQDWVSTVEETDNEDSKVEADKNNGILSRLLLEGLRSAHLIVLCGLGTSMCVKSKEGKVLALTMAELWAKAKERAEDFDKIAERVNFEIKGGKPWDYLKVLQTEFTRLQPTSFSDLLVLKPSQLV
jgi:hypothetical protein